ncbi:MAG TPA: metalloregulator ArsR/SmtB family transcription factor [Candidatus Limnocylindria bacterium]|nr:metalloregulator ArsR/SmtB family transcription factor [Candidatus Limnocylindria bacterium]
MVTHGQLIEIRKSLDGVEQRTIYKLLADANRYHIVKILSKYPKLIVSDIAKILGISIPLASQHLKALEQGDILEKEKLGQKAYLKLRDDNKVARTIIEEII